MDAILGQARAVDTLQSALITGRLHHAYIFHGPRGVGKFTTAREFARILLCHDRQRDLAGRVIACGSCESCLAMVPLDASHFRQELNKRRKRRGDDEEEDDDEEAAPADTFDREMHPDYHVIRKELAATSEIRELRDRKQMNIPVNLLRERMIGGKIGDHYYDAAVYKTPRMSHGKVFVIDEAELLEAEGQNALLKTLEEPSPDTYLILVTASEDKLLPTIRSRCQRVIFTALPDSVVAGWLAKNTQGMNDAQIQWLARFSTGSIGRAQMAVRFELFNWAKAVLPPINDMQRGIYPVQLGATIASLLGAFAEAWIEQHPAASKLAANQLAASLMWTMITQHARQKLADAAARHAGHDVMQQEAALEPWIRVIEAVGEAERNMVSHVHLHLVCDTLVAAMFGALTGATV
jgi:DNA polymerase-3 subunit delta'